MSLGQTSGAVWVHRERPISQLLRHSQGGAAYRAQLKITTPKSTGSPTRCNILGAAMRQLLQFVNVGPPLDRHQPRDLTRSSPPGYKKYSSSAPRTEALIIQARVRAVGKDPAGIDLDVARQQAQEARARAFAAARLPARPALDYDPTQPTHPQLAPLFAAKVGRRFHAKQWAVVSIRDLSNFDWTKPFAFSGEAHRVL
jgi:hypothetical protein